MKASKRLFSTMVLAVIAVSHFCGLVSISQSQPVIAIDADTTYQTMVGWEAESQAGQTECASFALYKDHLLDQAANDLGINRLRLGIRSGVENAQDYWSLYQAGSIDHDAWRSVRYATVNDNEDPFIINWAGFHFASLDNTIDRVVLPLKQRVEANGETLFINLNYTAFTNQIGPDLLYHHDDPQEYAEFVLATYLHLQSTYGWVPDAWEVILEPDNVSQWNGTLIGQAIVATANRLSAHGFTPHFIAPSNTNMGAAVSYFDALAQVPGALSHLQELSYHRYSGVSDANLQAIAQRSLQYGLNTAMLEHIGSGYEDLHKDLKMGRNSAWQQFTLAFCTNDNGAQYYWIDESNPTNPVVHIANRTKFLRQYFKFIRSGATRIGATSTNPTFDPLAFISPDGNYVVVVKATAGGSFAIHGLPAGTYGIKYTTSSEYDVDPPDQTIGPDQTLYTTIPAQGAITIYQKDSVVRTRMFYLPLAIREWCWPS